MRSPKAKKFVLPNGGENRYTFPRCFPPKEKYQNEEAHICLRRDDDRRGSIRRTLRRHARRHARLGRARPQPPQPRQDRRRARPAAERRHHPLRRHGEDVRQLVLDEDGAHQVEARERHARVRQGRGLHPHEGGVRPQLPAPRRMGHAREGRGRRTGPRQLRRVPDERLRAPGAGLLRDRPLEEPQPQPELRRRTGLRHLRPEPAHRQREPRPRQVADVRHRVPRARLEGRQGNLPRHGHRVPQRRPDAGQLGVRGPDIPHEADVEEAARSQGAHRVPGPRQPRPLPQRLAPPADRT